MRDPGSPSDRGTTLTEVLVVLFISGLVIPAIYLALASGFRQERTQDETILAERNLQRVADVLTEDIQNSWPSDKVWSTPYQSLSLEYLDERGEVMWIFWYLDGSSLVRVEMYAESEKVIAKEEMLVAVKQEEIFYYWTDRGEQIKEQMANCSVRVTVQLRSVTETTDVATTFDVAHRLEDPEAEPCV